MDGLSVDGLTTLMLTSDYQGGEGAPGTAQSHGTRTVRAGERQRKGVWKKIIQVGRQGMLLSRKP